MTAEGIFLDFIILLGSTTLVSLLCHTARIPLILGFLLTGLAVGPHSLALIKHPPNINWLTEIGAILLLFTIGLEFSIKKILKMKNWFLGPGVLQVLFVFGISFLVGYYLFKLSWQASVLLGFMLSLSSTATVMKIAKREEHAPYANASMSLLLFQDLMVIPMILILPLLANTNETQTLSITAFLIQFISGLIIIALVIWLSRKVIPHLFAQVLNIKSREVFFFCILFTGALIAYLMHKLGFSYSLGAFIAGLMIAESPYGKQVLSELSPLRDIFLGFFFVAIGMMIIPAEFIQHIDQILLVAIVLLSLKFVAISSVLYISGYPLGLSVFVGGVLFQVGEFSFILLDKGLSLNIFTPEQSQIFLSVIALSIGFTPYVFNFMLKKKIYHDTNFIFSEKITHAAQAIRKLLPFKPLQISHTSTKDKEALNDHTIIIGFGAAGQNICMTLKILGLPYAVIEMNPTTVKKYKNAGEPISFGNASSAEVLYAAGINRARLVIVTVSGRVMTQTTLFALRKLRPDIKIIVRTQYLQELHEIKTSKNTEIVVAEFEASMELLNLTLREYKVSPTQAYQFITESRKFLTGKFNSKQFKHRIDFPANSAVGNIYPLKLEFGDAVINKNLVQLDIRKKTGATIISIYRPGFGTTTPNTEFLFAADDIVYLIGSEDSFQQAKKILKS